MRRAVQLLLALLHYGACRDLALSGTSASLPRLQEPRYQALSTKCAGRWMMRPSRRPRRSRSCQARHSYQRGTRYDSSHRCSLPC